MFENDRKELASKEVTSIWHRNGMEKSTWKADRYFVDFESRIHVEISTSNRCHSFTYQNRWNLDEVSTQNFDTELMANRQRCVHWVDIWILQKSLKLYIFDQILMNHICKLFFLHNFFGKHTLIKHQPTKTNFIDALCLWIFIDNISLTNFGFFFLRVF